MVTINVTRLNCWHACVYKTRKPVNELCPRFFVTMLVKGSFFLQHVQFLLHVLQLHIKRVNGH